MGKNIPLYSEVMLFLRHKASTRLLFPTIFQLFEPITANFLFFGPASCACRRRHCHCPRARRPPPFSAFAQNFNRGISVSFIDCLLTKASMRKHWCCIVSLNHDGRVENIVPEEYVRHCTSLKLRICFELHRVLFVSNIFDNNKDKN